MVKSPVIGVNWTSLTHICSKYYVVYCNGTEPMVAYNHIRMLRNILYDDNAISVSRSQGPLINFPHREICGKIAYVFGNMMEFSNASLKCL